MIAQKRNHLTKMLLDIDVGSYLVRHGMAAGAVSRLCDRLLFVVG